MVKTKGKLKTGGREEKAETRETDSAPTLMHSPSISSPRFFPMAVCEYRMLW